MLTGLLHYYTLLSKEFLLFSTMPIPIEMVMPIGTTIAVCLMALFAVNTLKDMRAWLAFFGGHSICFLVVHATPCFLSVVFCVVSSIAFCASGGMRMTTKCWMPPLPTVLALRNVWVHVIPTNGCNKSSNVKSTIDDVLHARTTLGIPDVHPDHCLIRFGQCFNDASVIVQLGIGLTLGLGLGQSKYCSGNY